VETTSTARTHRRPAVLAVVAVVAIAALVLVAIGRGSDPPVIHLGAAGSTAPMTEAAADGDASLGMRAFPVEYRFVLADPARFPAGEETAWKLEPPADLRSATAELADRLGLEGEATSPFGDGALQVGPLDGSGPMLWVGPSGDWSFSDQSWMPEVRCAEEPIPVEPDEAAAGEGVSSSEGDEGVETLEEPAPCEPVSPPSNVPGEAAARTAAEALFADLGLAVTPRITEVHADEWGAWVSATLPLGSMDSDVHLSVGLGPDAMLTSANGTLADLVEVDRYPTIDADAAVARLADQHSWQGRTHDVVVDGDVAVDSPAAGATEAAPDAAVTDLDAAELDPEPGDEDVSILPAPEPEGDPEVLTVTLVEAAPLAMLIMDADQTAWLLPGVRFTDDEGGIWQVLTVADEYLDTAEEPSGPEPAPEPGTDPGTEEPAEPEQPREGPVPDPDAPTTDDPDAPTTDDPDAAPAEAVAADLVGLSEDDALAIVQERGFEARVVARDGEEFAVTDDYRLDRINLRIEAGVVTAADVG
jgi:hypothetical protein